MARDPEYQTARAEEIKRYCEAEREDLARRLKKSHEQQEAYLKARAKHPQRATEPKA